MDLNKLDRKVGMTAGLIVGGFFLLVTLGAVATDSSMVGQPAADSMLVACSIGFEVLVVSLIMGAVPGIVTGYFAYLLSAIATGLWEKFFRKHEKS